MKTRHATITLPSDTEILITRTSMLRVSCSSRC